MSEIVPLRALPRQTAQCQLGNQTVVLNVYQTTGAMFVDVMIGAALIAGGVLALDRNKMVRYAYLGFVGDLAFVDTLGTQDPVYTGLGTRFQLVYLEEADLASGG